MDTARSSDILFLNLALVKQEGTLKQQKDRNIEFEAIKEESKMDRVRSENTSCLHLIR